MKEIDIILIILVAAIVFGAIRLMRHRKKHGSGCCGGGSVGGCSGGVSCSGCAGGGRKCGCSGNASDGKGGCCAQSGAGRHKT